MALFDPNPLFYRPYGYYYEAVNCVTEGAQVAYLSVKGFYPVSHQYAPMPLRYREVMPALGSQPVQINLATDVPAFEPYDLEMKATLFRGTATTDAFRELIHLEQQKWGQIAQGYVDENVSWDERHLKHNHIRWDISGSTAGGSFSQYWQYANFLGSEIKAVPMTGGAIVNCSLFFRVTDPTWYGGMVTDTINVVDCGDTTEAIASQYYRRGHRICVYVRNNTPYDRPSLVVLTNQRGDTANFNGQLTSNDEYWKMDCIEGRVYRGTSYVTEVDVTGTQFSGDFLSFDVNGDLITASCDDATSGDGATTSFQVSIYSRRPYS